jgi:hypothetical protein
MIKLDELSFKQLKSDKIIRRPITIIKPAVKWWGFSPIVLKAGSTLNITFNAQSYTLHAVSDQTITGFRVVNGEPDWRATYD